MKTQLERSAHHEAGHILLSYVTDYSCEQVVLNANADGDSMARQNYGEDLLLITAITNAQSEPTIFNDLPKSVKGRTPGVANKITSILLAGSVCESIFLNDGAISASMEVEVSGPDLIRVDNVHYLLSQIIPGHDPNFIQNKTLELFDFFVLEEFTKAAGELAAAMLNKPDYTLDQTEIEAVLTANGFLDYISQFK